VVQTLKYMEMENLVVGRNKKVSVDIPDDLAFSILSKMSIKSLKRTECVCKSWTLLFENPYFMSLFRKKFLCHNHSCYDDDSSFLELQFIRINFEDYKYVLYSLSGERFENKTKLDWINPFQEEDPEFDVVGTGSVNGILCLTSYTEPNNRVVLWNPTTKEFKVIPTSLCESVRHVDVEITRHGFGYDSTSDDYKVIRQVLYAPKSDIDSESDSDDESLEDISYKLFWEIYSLRSNSWRKFDANHVPNNYSEEGMCHDGVYHWLGEDQYDSESYLLSFDLSNEIFLITHMPSEIDSLYVGYRWKDLLILNGFFALISACVEYDTFHISVLGELGIKESWIKLYTVYLVPYIERPINARKNIYIFAQVRQGILVSTDSSTLMVEQLGYVGRHAFFSKTIVYKGSNLPIGGINQ